MLFAKPVVAMLIVWVLRYPFKTALAVGVALAQIGEFSFILSSLARELGILEPAAGNTIVAASIVSIVINPLWYRAIDPIDRWTTRHPRLWRWLNGDAARPDATGRPAPASGWSGPPRAVPRWGWRTAGRCPM